MKSKAALQLYIRRNVDPGPGGCWLWRLSCFGNGYGAARAGDGKRWKAHRLAFYAWNDGPIPPMVRHTCDVPQCCNPDHLLAGDAISNKRDAIERGRDAHGEGHPDAKLTDELVLEMRQRHADGETVSGIWRALAWDLCSRATASHAILGRTWKHLPMPASSCPTDGMA